MNRTICLTLPAAAALLGASAIDNPQLAQRNGCTACHAVDNKMLGPANPVHRGMFATAQTSHRSAEKMRGVSWGRRTPTAAS